MHLHPKLKKMADADYKLSISIKRKILARVQIIVTSLQFSNPSLAPLILMGYFASLPIGQNSVRSPIMYCAILMPVLVCAHATKYTMPAYVSEYIQLMVFMLRCILDVVLFFVFGQSLNASRDSPMSVPTELLYAIPLISCIFVIPERLVTGGLQQLLTVSAFIALCLILSSDTGTAHPYPVPTEIGITVFVLLAAVYAAPRNQNVEQRQRPNVVTAGVKYMAGVLFIYMYAFRKSGQVDHFPSSFTGASGQAVTVRDFHSLRHVTDLNQLSSVFIRLHFALSAAVWFSHLRALATKNLSPEITMPNRYTSDIHELFVACAIFIVMIAAFSISKVSNTVTRQHCD